MAICRKKMVAKTEKKNLIFFLNDHFFLFLSRFRFSTSSYEDKHIFRPFEKKIWKKVKKKDRFWWCLSEKSYKFSRKTTFLANFFPDCSQGLNKHWLRKLFLKFCFYRQTNIFFCFLKKENLKRNQAK
jgi:hypothetical protein